MNLNENSDSDDDVFFGKLTLKEVKKHIFMKPLPNILISANDRNGVCKSTDFKIIETNSGPKIPTSLDKESPTEQLKSFSDPHYNKPELLSLESTLPNFTTNDCTTESEEIKSSEMTNNRNLELGNVVSSVSEVHKEEKQPVINEINQNINCGTNLLTDVHLKIPQNKKLYKENNSSNDSKTSKIISNIPTSSKKNAHVTSTPSRTNAYQHIASPVATYIKGLQDPTAKYIKPVNISKNVHGISSAIPKPINIASKSSISNKENVSLTPAAYGSAKKMSAINSKLPQSLLTKKVMSVKKSISLKNEKREIDGSTSVFLLENSCADLSLNK